MRRDFYVYVHMCPEGNVFYVGKGCGKRAWSTDRQATWQHYVQNHLKGHYSVQIVRDGLTEQEALDLEESEASRYGGNLVNCLNQFRAFDLEKHDEVTELRTKVRYAVSEARGLEAIDPQAALASYRLALEWSYRYHQLDVSPELYSSLVREQSVGDTDVLDRITLILVRLGQLKEAQELARQYFGHFPAAAGTARGKAVTKRTKIAT